MEPQATYQVKTPARGRQVTRARQVHARCYVCGGPVIPECETDAALMAAYPKDGQWRCELHRGAGKASRG